MKEEIKRSIESLINKELIADEIEKSSKPMRDMLRKQITEYLSTAKFKSELKKLVESELLDALSENGLFDCFTSKEYDALCKKAVLSVIK